MSPPKGCEPTVLGGQHVVCPGLSRQLRASRRNIALEEASPCRSSELPTVSGDAAMRRCPPPLG
jgi:hypothetical protein